MKIKPYVRSDWYVFQQLFQEAEAVLIRKYGYDSVFPWGVGKRDPDLYQSCMDSGFMRVYFICSDAEDLLGYLGVLTPPSLFWTVKEATILSVYLRHRLARKAKVNLSKVLGWLEGTLDKEGIRLIHMGLPVGAKTVARMKAFGYNNLMQISGSKYLGGEQ